MRPPFRMLVLCTSRQRRKMKLRKAVPDFAWYLRQPMPEPFMMVDHAQRESQADRCLFAHAVATLLNICHRPRSGHTGE